MRNRVEKLMKEKRRANSQIRIAKNRGVFMGLVNTEKSKEREKKEEFRRIMREKLNEKKEF